MKRFTYQDIQIVHEDNHIIVAYKPAGVLSQADGSDAQDMLTLLKEYIKIKYNKPGNVYLGLLHRLDRPVEGLMIFAKTSKAASRLSDQIRQGKMDKLYYAVVQGAVNPSEGRLVHELVKDKKTNITKAFLPNKVPSNLKSMAKNASLKYKVIKTNATNTISLIEVELETGRSHQIRTQFAAIGHPLLGDAKYGNPNSGYRGDICLESHKIGIIHPVSGERMLFEVGVAPRFEKLF